MARLFALAVIVCVAGSAGAQKTLPPFKAKLHVEVGDVSLEGKKLPAVFTFTNKTDEEQKFGNVEYRYAVLDSKGDLVEDVLVESTVLRTVTLKGRSATDKPDLSVNGGKLKAGETYYLVVSVRGLTAMGKFGAKK